MRLVVLPVLLRLVILLLRLVLLLIVPRLEILLLLLLLLHLRIVRLVLPRPVIIPIVELVIGRALLLLLRLLPLLSLLLIIGILLPKLFLRRRDQSEVVLCVLIIIFGGDGITGALRVARELNIFFSHLGSGTANFYIGPVRLINSRQRILTLAVVIVVPAPHPLVIVSHSAVH